MRWIAAAGLPLCAGCGGLFDGGAGFEPRYEEAISTYSEVIAFAPTSPGEMPGGDGVAFDGQILLDFEVLVLGDASITVNFGGGDLNGTFENFVDGDDVAVAGSGTLSGIISGATVNAVLSGSGVSEGQTYTITDQPLPGGFRGPNAEALRLAGPVEYEVSGVADDVFVSVNALQ